MILCTSVETGLPAYIWVNEIVRVESHGGRSPFSRIFLQDTKQHHDYFLDVTQSTKEISKRIDNDRLHPGENTEASNDG